MLLFKNKPREEWEIHKHQQSFEQSNRSSNKSAAVAIVSISQSTSSNQVSETSRSETGWSGAYIGFAQSYAMQDWILLDNQSSVTVFSNKELVENIRDSNDTLTLYTNGVVLITRQKCDIPQWGRHGLYMMGLRLFSATQKWLKDTK
jgi:hypothetical protein